MLFLKATVTESHLESHLEWKPQVLSMQVMEEHGMVSPILFSQFKTVLLKCTSAPSTASAGQD